MQCVYINLCYHFWSSQNDISNSKNWKHVGFGQKWPFSIFKQWKLSYFDTKVFSSISAIWLLLYLEPQIFLYDSIHVLATISSGSDSPRLPWQLSDEPKCKKSPFLFIVDFMQFQQGSLKHLQRCYSSQIWLYLTRTDTNELK